MPLFGHAQTSPGRCLIEYDSDNRISGKLEYVEYEHPGRHEIIIRGYKITLLKARCYELADILTDEKTRHSITEVAISNWADNFDFLKANAGKLITVTGSMETILSPYYVAVPQIYVSKFAPCEIAPKSNNLEKC